MSGKHNAAFLDGAGKAFRVDSIETKKPGKGEVLIRNRALAINPVDWKVQDSGYFLEEFPSILGEDVAGEIEAVGDGVTRFKPGQRVLAHSQFLFNKKLEQAGFQVSKFGTCPNISAEDWLRSAQSDFLS